MKVSAVFHPAVACLDPGATLATAASLMHAGEFGSVAVYEGDSLVGILTETDIVRAIADHRKPETTAIAEFMSRDPVTARLDDDSMEVAERMVRGGFRHVLVLEEGRLIGMVSARDLLQVEAWPPAKHRGSGLSEIDHPVRPRRGNLVEPRTQPSMATDKLRS